MVVFQCWVGFTPARILLIGLADIVFGMVLVQRVSRGPRVLRRREKKLQDLRVKPVIRSRYLRAVQCFIKYVGGSFPDVRLWDELGAESLQWLWNEGYGSCEVAYFICASSFVLLQLKPSSSLCWSLYNSWRKHETPVHACVVSENVVCSFVVTAIMYGEAFLRIASLIMYFGLFRIAETLRVRWSDILIQKVSGCVVLGVTKGSRGGTFEIAVIRSLWLLKFLRRLKPHFASSALVCSLSAAKFGRSVHAYASDLGLSGKWSPYSIRRGSACVLFRSSQSYQTCAELGRWRFVKSVRVYVDLALEHLVGIIVAQQTHVLVDARAATVRHVVEHFVVGFIKNEMIHGFACWSIAVFSVLL